MKLPFALLGGLVLAQSVSLHAEDRALRFPIGERDYAMPVPEGYCMPDGPLVEVARTAAASDPLNFTPVVAFACNGGTIPLPVERYILIKTPRDAVDETVDKSAWLASLEAELRGFGPDEDARIREMSEKSYERATGDSVEIDLKPARIARDDECVYVSEPFAAASGERSITGHAVACYTFRGQRPIWINFYDLTPEADVESLKAAARSVARSIDIVP